MVAKYVCVKLVVQRVLIAVVAKVANLICDYLIVISWLRWLQSKYVNIQAGFPGNPISVVNRGLTRFNTGIKFSR